MISLEFEVSCRASSQLGMSGGAQEALIRLRRSTARFWAPPVSGWNGHLQAKLSFLTSQQQYGTTPAWSTNPPVHLKLHLPLCPRAQREKSAIVHTASKTSFAKSRDKMLRFPKCTPSSPGLPFEVMFMNITYRIKDMHQPWRTEKSIDYVSFRPSEDISPIHLDVVFSVRETFHHHPLLLSLLPAGSPNLINCTIN